MASKQLSRRTRRALIYLALQWSREVQEAAQQRVFRRRARPGLQIPPYLTSEPVITTTKISPEKGVFLIMATDGLWDRLTDEQAVDLVGKWLDKHNPRVEVLLPLSTLVDGRNHDQLRADTYRHPESRGDPEPQKAYVEHVARADSKHLVVKDSNAATHFIRNALGGNNEDMLRGLLTVPPPNSRNLKLCSSCPFTLLSHKTWNIILIIRIQGRYNGSSLILWG